jgi:hypothetical protein
MSVFGNEDRPMKPTTNFLIDGSTDARFTILLAHGAGAPMDSKSMTAATAALVAIRENRRLALPRLSIPSSRQAHDPSNKSPRYNSNTHSHLPGHEGRIRKPRGGCGLPFIRSDRDSLARRWRSRSQTAQNRFGVDGSDHLASMATAVNHRAETHFPSKEPSEA